MKQIEDLGIVIVAAGSSSRFGEKDKLLLPLNGMPLFLNSVNTFLSLIPAENIIIVTGAERIAEFKEIVANTLQKDVAVTAGGAERKDSALNGLNALPKLKYAAVHDAARPYITTNAILKCYSELTRSGSAVLAHPVTDTIKIANEKGCVMDTPPRNSLFAAETPQMFIKDDLINAYTNPPPNVALTDEAMAMEKTGCLVQLVIHEEDNRKITYEKDLF
jgi:2-C-methyl-D-erythritol 4-phosphate cytidylyltransferase